MENLEDKNPILLNVSEKEYNELFFEVDDLMRSSFKSGYKEASHDNEKFRMFIDNLIGTNALSDKKLINKFKRLCREYYKKYDSHM
jgi:hypothetical protein